LFGIDRLRTVIEAQSESSAQVLVEAIVSAVEDFSQSGSPSDDVTILTFQRTNKK
jgi:serine phosphatase RsbU (regulator of sigma subunit)